MRDIIWDLDGVVSDFRLGFNRFAADRFPHHLVSSQGAAKRWGISGLTQEQETTIWLAIENGDYNWSKQSSLLNAGDWVALRNLKALGTTFWYVTSRSGPPEQVRAETMLWLEREGFPDIENIAVTGDKVKAIRYHPAGLHPVALIDDDIRNIVAYSIEFGPEVTYLRDWQYNRVDEVLRVYGDLDVPSAVTGKSGAGLAVAAARTARRVSSVAEFCYAAMESIDGIDRG